MGEHATRRGLLAVAGAGMAGLAGCLGGLVGDDEIDGDPDGGATGGDRPAWQTTAFEDARTGETVSVAEADGPVVLHTFATWCSTCLSQQQDLAVLHEQSGEEVRIIDLTIDENDDPDDIATHAENNGFDWRFGVAPAELRNSLVDDIGDDVVFAPRSPVVVVCPDGAAFDLGKGVSADTITDTIDEHCSL